MSYTKTQFSVLAVVTLTAFMSTFLISSANIALPAIEKEFQMNAVSIGWIITGFLLASGIVLLPVGRFGDLTGIRRIFKIGVAVYTLSSVFCALAPNGNYLIAGRFIQGIAAAFTSTTGPAILITAFPVNQRGKVLGISVSAVYLGLAFGPFAGGILTQYLDWRSIFYTAAFLGIVAAVPTFLFLGKDKIKPISRMPDLKGSLVYMAGLVVLVYGSTHIPEIKGWVLMGAGVLALILFWFLESRSKRPVIEIGLYKRNRLFTFSNLAALINYSATFAIIFLLSLYLQKIKELTPRDAGVVMVAQPAVMALLSPIAGRISDRIQPRYLATAGMSVCTLGLVGFAFLSAATPIWMVVALLVWVGLGFALFSSPNMNTIMSSVDKSRYGLASGSASTMRVIGQIVSMTVATLFFSGFMGKQPIETVSDELFLQAFKWGFFSFAFISLFGIYFSINRGSINRDTSELKA